MARLFPGSPASASGHNPRAPDQPSAADVAVGQSRSRKSCRLEDIPPSLLVQGYMYIARFVRMGFDPLDGLGVGQVPGVGSPSIDRFKRRMRATAPAAYIELRVWTT